jgi:hypothetical protein
MKYQIEKDTIVDSKYGVINEGEYLENDLVICYLIGDLDKNPYCLIEAKYIIFGHEAYQ